jgi:hypothetical protein
MQGYVMSRRAARTLAPARPAGSTSVVVRGGCCAIGFITPHCLHASGALGDAQSRRCRCGTATPCRQSRASSTFCRVHAVGDSRLYGIGWGSLWQRGGCHNLLTSLLHFFWFVLGLGV